MTESKTSETRILMGTVNAPFYRITAEELADALCSQNLEPGQVHSFFTEIPADEQLAFAREYKIPETELKKTASMFADWSNRSVDLAF